MKQSPPGHEWYQSAVIYEVDVKNYYDANGDGIGDFRGLIERIDYLVDLGVTCVWLQPFYATPDRDNGYDVSDFHRVNERLGTLSDFDAFVRAAKERGIRIMADLPLNHCSNEHDWFQAARADRDSPYRDFFTWADQLPENPSPYPIFGPEQGGNWEWDEAAGQYYFHTFYRYMPDLNIENPRVRQELFNIARFWMERGIDGFRLDAVPYLTHFRSDGEQLHDPHDFWKDLHKLVTSINPEAVLLAEANLKPDEMRPFFGDGEGDEMHLLLNFYLCNHVFLSVATGQKGHIQRAWDELPDIPVRCNWANFLRNHDELSLDQLTDEEREQVFRAFAPEQEMQLYGRGIRRRLAPMLDGDLRRIKLIYSLLLTLPGTPVINLGEELGLGDDLTLKEREAGRTPMQWSAETNGGFSRAAHTYRPVVSSGPFSYQRVNVATQAKDPDSLLNFFRRAIAGYKEVAAFGRGTWTFTDCGDEHVLVHRCDWQGQTAFAIHNLSGELKTVQVTLPAGMEQLLGDGEHDPDDGQRFHLAPYGFRWLRTRERSDEHQ